MSDIRYEPPLVLSMGEPAGIGGEILLKAWSALRREGPAFFALHDPLHLDRLQHSLEMDVPIRVIGSAGEANSAFRDALPVLPIDLPAPVVPGTLEPRNASAVIEAIRLGVELATLGDASGLVTNPIHKAALYTAGFGFPGHTEYLESLAGAPHRAIMMLASEFLRVVPVTIHQSLVSAIADLTTERIVQTVRDTAHALSQDFGIHRPRLAIAGLNPHAGEDGSMGREEIETITPAIGKLRAEGIDAFGPLPPDTMFTHRARQTYDAAICMYHDQALIPLKTLDMDGGVNVTMGLPFVRTSPDHGTALDLAGKGIADPGSLIAAIRFAARLAAHRRSTRSTA